MSALISIIVPVYNIENYITKCIESIIAQDYSDKELILVDDGSTDHSGEICDRYAACYPWITVLHDENAGLSEARNRGMRVCNGEWIVFVDGDDFVDKKYLSILYNIAEKSRADIVCCQFYKVDDTVETPFNSEHEYSYVTKDRDSAVRDLLYQRTILTSAWGKLFKTVLFKDIFFPVGKIHEDVGTIYKLFFLADVVACTECKLYYYLRRNDSIVHQNFSPKKMDAIEFTQETIDFCKAGYPQFLPAAISRHFSACFQVISVHGIKSYQQYYDYLIQEIKKYRKQVLMDKEARFINRMAALISLVSVRLAVRLCAVLKRRRL